MSIPDVGGQSGASASVPGSSGSIAPSSLPDTGRASSSVPDSNVPSRGGSVPDSNLPVRPQRDPSGGEPVPPPPFPPPPEPVPPVDDGFLPDNLEEWLAIDPDLLDRIEQRKEEVSEKIYMNFQIWLQTQDDIKSIREELGDQPITDKLQREDLENKVEQFVKRFGKGQVARPITRKIKQILEEKTEAIGRKVAEMFGQRAGEMARKFPTLFAKYRQVSGKVSAVGFFGLGLDIGTSFLSMATHSRIDELHQFDKIFGNVPVVGSFYNASVQLGETLLHAFGIMKSDSERREASLRKREKFLQRYSENIRDRIARASYWEEEEELLDKIRVESQTSEIARDRTLLREAYQLVKNMGLRENHDVKELRAIARQRYPDSKANSKWLFDRLYYMTHPDSGTTIRELERRRSGDRQFITAN